MIPPSQSPTPQSPVESPPDDTAGIPANLRLFEHLYQLLLPWIIRRARRLSEGDRDLQDDLIQTGLCTMWELCTPTVTTLDPAIVRADIHRAMLDFRRAERRADVICCTAHRWQSNTERTARYIPVHSTNHTSVTR